MSSEDVEKRPRYRSSRRDIGVRVFCIAQESIYVLIDNVHAIGVDAELIATVSQFAPIEEHQLLHDRATEEFTEAHLFKFANIEQARKVKKSCNELYFMGKHLHADYAPEFETQAETMTKIEERLTAVQRRIEQCEQAQTAYVLSKQSQRRQSTIATAEVPSTFPSRPPTIPNLASLAAPGSAEHSALLIRERLKRVCQSLSLQTHKLTIIRSCLLKYPKPLLLLLFNRLYNQHSNQPNTLRHTQHQQ